MRLRPYDGPHPYPKKIFSQFVSLLSPDQKQVIREFSSYGRDANEEHLLEREAKWTAELDEEEEGERVTEEGVEQPGAFWRIREQERSDFTIMIEYWSNV